jgi:TfoX/Sxy family transcriptional regulator of competence genes
MNVPKPSDEDKARFRALIPEAPGVEVKAMFGNLGAFVNGNMFAGLFGSAIGVKVIQASSREELAAIPGTGPYGPAERPMGGYLALPAAWAKTPMQAAPWIERAMLEVGTLPPKKPKPVKKTSAN